ncbi:MAG: 50S ribosomal protein L29 [Fibrobacter sp.]|nr:50S ribosomal protein L29 [Fibrobacter sp.]
MKAKEIRELSTEEMTRKIDLYEEELFNLRFQAKIGQLANPLQLRFIRRDIARINTILKEKAAAK